jgi:thiol-disulfide isomerase/thioredoxin
VIIFFQSAGLRWVMSAAVFLSLAGLSAGTFFPGVAQAQESSMSMQRLDASGRPIGSNSERVPVKVSGTVLDADTRQPLPAFNVITGTQDRERTGFDWAETNRVSFGRGAFTLILTKERLAPAVLIEAEGYLPQHSGPIHGTETNLTFLLKKGSGPTGVVLTPDGRPAEGRTVYYSRLKDLIFLEGPSLAPKKLSARVRSTVTDASGRFSFAPDIDGFGVVVADDTGFADVRVEDLKSLSEVRLQPWARVEGTLKIGTHSATNETVRLSDAFAPYAYYPRPLPSFTISVEATTDSDGRFVFPRVPPVDVKIFHVPKVGRKETGFAALTQITNITLTAGETRALTLGGQGRAVTGRVVLKNYTKPIHWQDEVFWMNSLSPEPPDCPNFDGISKEYHAAIAAARTQADKEAAQSRYLAEHDRVSRQLCAYYSSPAGRRYWFSKRQYVLRFSPDGSFRIDDVPGGKYEMTIDLRELIGKMGQIKSPLIALYRHEIDVPDAPGGRSDTPLDLGIINMLARLNPGDIAPEFAVKTVDDKTVKLSDYKGKYVLLDFWETSSPAAVAEVPHLKETYAAFKSDPRFVMIALNLDPDIASARTFSIENQLAWTQGWLGRRSETDLLDRYGIETIPSVVLIDPNGRVIASALHGGAIKSTVDAVLSEPPRE